MKVIMGVRKKKSSERLPAAPSPLVRDHSRQCLDDEVTESAAHVLTDASQASDGSMAVTARHARVASGGELLAVVLATTDPVLAQKLYAFWLKLLPPADDKTVATHEEVDPETGAALRVERAWSPHDPSTCVNCLAEAAARGPPDFTDDDPFPN